MRKSFICVFISRVERQRVTLKASVAQWIYHYPSHLLLTRVIMDAYVCICERPLLSSLFLSFSLFPRKRAASLERARMQRRLVSLPRQSLADKSKRGDETNETTRPTSRTLDGIVSSLGSQLATRFFSLAGLRTNCRGTTASVNDCAQLLCPATPPSFIPDKGKIGRERERGARPVEYANTATRKRWRNSKPVFRITFSLSSRQIRGH